MFYKMNLTQWCFSIHTNYILGGLCKHIRTITSTKTMNDAFNEDSLVSKEPIGQFSAWYEEVKNSKIKLANAACLATASKDGVPSSRIIIVESCAAEGFKFFTDNKSRKVKDLEENPAAALTFYWPTFNRQVRIEGTVKKVSEQEAVEHFNRMSIESKLCAILSPQSCVIPDRDFLVKAYKELAKGEVTKPESWVGYVLHHELVEFWQGQEDKIHDRIVYSRSNGEWKINRLAP